MSHKIRPWHLILVGAITFLVNALILLKSEDMKNALLQKHIFHVEGLSMGILLIGWILSIRYTRDGGIIILFGSLILMAEVFYAGISMPVLFIISILLSSLAGLGLILLARKQDKI